MAQDLRKRTRSRLIESFADVDFIAFETDFRTEAKAKKLGKAKTGLLCLAQVRGLRPKIGLGDSAKADSIQKS